MSPLLYKSTNERITEADMSGSIVNLVLSQSHEQPNCFNCSKMVPPYLLVQSQACLRNSSRVKSFLLMPSLFNLATTLASVAIDAWSVPGTQHALKPFKRARLINTSCMVLLSMCPMCKTPVTLGGGMVMVYGLR